MKSYLYPILALVFSAIAGWLLAQGGFASAPKSSADSKSTTSSSRQLHASQELARRTFDIAKNPDLIPISMLDRLSTLRGSPRLSAGFWMGDGDRITDPGFQNLVDWLQLSESQKNSLADILREAANDRRAWEQGNMHAERLEAGIYQLSWIDHDSESLPTLRQALAREFGDKLGETIFIRGNLHRFFEPVPDWKKRGVPQIQLKITPRSGGGAFLQFKNGDWNMSYTQSEGKFPIESLKRLDHVFDCRTDAEAIFKSNEQSEYQYAESVPGIEGFVLSPFNGKQIDVRGLPPGTLVRDPTLPASEKALFRIPQPASE